jgi:hypothetical protein
MADLEGHRARVRRMDNRALFEIPVLLDRIFVAAQAVQRMEGSEQPVIRP